MPVPADNARADRWASLEPYAQLVRSLLPRASGIAVFDSAANLRWSNDTAVWPDLVHAVEQSAAEASADSAAPGQLRVLEGNVPLYLCWLRDDTTQQLLAVIAIQCRASSDGEQRSFSFVHALIRPALECLRRELLARHSLDLLTENLSARDRDLELVLAVSSRDGARPGDDASALRVILENSVEHLGCALAALLVPDKSLVLFRMSREQPADGRLLAQTHRHLLSLGQVRREPLIMNRLAQGSAFGTLPYKILSCSLRNAAGRPIGIFALYRHEAAADFNDREARLAEVLARKASMIIESSYDAMTGLLNRQAFEQRAADLIAGAAAGKPLAVLYVDVDQLHLVNENFGMHVGDLMLSMLADMMRRRLPPAAVAARISGDRFAVVVPGPLEAALELATSWCETAAQLAAVQGDERSRASLSIGVAELVPGDVGLTHTLAAAETACKAAKDRGRNRAEAYQAADESVVRRFTDITIAASLRAAVADDRLRLDAQFIQPLDAAPSRPPHFEVLLRMIDDEGRTLGPDRFLSAANRYQLMPTIDRWVIERALGMLRPHAGLIDATGAVFAINFSGQSLNDAEFADELIARIEASGIGPQHLCFELTESATIANLARAELLMRRLRKLGCGVALDDFGTGLSSLAYLRQLPVSMLKIDGSFVRDILRDARSESLVQAIAQLARSMQMVTVAEYVETDAIRERIAALGVDYAQGFSIGRPVPLADVLADLQGVLARAPRIFPDPVPPPAPGLH
ncbi:MAG: bifunctional diguanylate cyclase/phosphodiesterase [Steroidobacteraceae bacterium]|nr:bifunctional diguanylate cyclase/phosphodiesterase [Steroidobacteraceae bacterium]MCW5571975.1 bifunctional diguanylate cyclase/phosphodiesterase [Steroidobacteraceae bacterium]